jgi:hypothetical protein
MLCVFEEARDGFVGECLAPVKKHFASDFLAASLLLLPVGLPSVFPLMNGSPRTRTDPFRDVIIFRQIEARIALPVQACRANLAGRFIAFAEFFRE